MDEADDSPELVLEELIEEDAGFESDGEVGSYFRASLVQLRRALGPQGFRKFAQLDRNSERVAFVLGYPQAHRLSTEAPAAVSGTEGKSAEGARLLKEKGNKLFGSEKYDAASVEYSRAIMLAPREDLPVILGNRSAAFYHLGLHEAALTDCEEALAIGYPAHLLYKLEERRARCLLAIKSHWRAMEAFRSAIQALDSCEKLSGERKKKFESDIRMMLAVMDKGQEINDAKGITRDRILEHEEQLRSRGKPDPRIPRLKTSNPVYPACSSAVEIRNEGGDVGRHALAARDIAPGELLVVEAAHASFLLGEYRLTHCHRCLKRILAPLPAKCYLCSSVAYCSPECRDSDERIHETECRILSVLWESKCSVTCMMALKIVIQRPFDEFVKLKSQVEKLKNGDIQASKANPYLGHDYRALYTLVSHESERTAEDLFQRAFIASWLLRVLKTTNYFPSAVKTDGKPGTPLSEGELFVAGAILHHLQLLQFNPHEVAEFTRPKGTNDVTKGGSIFVGGGVFPTVALFNHSCNPGVIRYFVGTTMIVRAIRSIPAGCEISENYGPIFTETEENDRKRLMRLRYWFDCNCEACTEHWPLLQDLDPNILRFKCETGPTCGNVLLVRSDTSEFMIRCSKCGNNTNMFKGLKALQDTDRLYNLGTKELESGKLEDALKSFLKILKTIDETLALPMRDYHLCQQRIRQCMLPLGNSAII